MRSPVLAGLAALLPTACLLSLGLVAPLLAAPTLSEDSCCQFDVYLQEGAIEGDPRVNGAGVDGPYGAFVRSISIGLSGVIYNDHNGFVRFAADDVMVGPGDGDITADITFSGGMPIRIVPVHSLGADTQSARWRYIFDFKMNGQVIVSRWQTHYGETFDLPWIGPLFSAAAAAPRVNTPTPTATKANVDFTLTHLHTVDGAESATFDFGDGIHPALPLPLPATVSHEYTLGAPSVKSRTFTAYASMTNGLGGAGSQITVTVLRQPDVALRIDGQTVLDGATVEVEAGRLLQLSLANSLGYIEQASFAIGGKLDQAGAGLSYSGILFGDSDLGQTYPLTAGVSNTGAGINADSMTVNLSVVPEPATLGLLGFAAFGLLGRLRRQG